jgi:hypothetical protein
MWTWTWPNGLTTLEPWVGFLNGLNPAQPAKITTLHKIPLAATWGPGNQVMNVLLGHCVGNRENDKTATII